MQLTWEPADEAWLRNILGQPSGQRLIMAMRSNIPKVKAVTKETAWIQAVQKQGAEDFFDAFLGLAESELPTQREAEAIDLTKEGD